MALFGFNSSRYEMLMSVCFTCLCNSTHRKLRCVGNFNTYTYQQVNDIRARRGNACVRICSVIQQSSTSGTEWQLSAIQSWLDRESSYKRLSQMALNLVASLASQAYVERLFSLYGDLTARKRNSTKVSLCRRVFLNLNRRILH